MSYNFDDIDFDDADYDDFDDADYDDVLSEENGEDGEEESDEEKLNEELDVYGLEADVVQEEKIHIPEELYKKEITVLEKSVIISKRVLQLTDFRIKRNPKLPDSELKRLGLTKLIDIANYEFDNRMDIPILFERSGVLIPVNTIFEYEKKQEEDLLSRLLEIEERNPSW